ncbi:hypothetical protein DQG13_12570 [Paenibacillus sp. YN15]|nr:hypothetical protein DQG13_12570 [Paenibacillus sp. YN15]
MGGDGWLAGQVRYAGAGADGGAGAVCGGWSGWRGRCGMRGLERMAGGTGGGMGLAHLYASGFATASARTAP